MNHVATMQADHRALCTASAPQPQRANRSRSKYLIVWVIAVALISVVMVALPQRSQAAHAVISIGPGYQIPNPYRDSIIGGFRAPDGTILYCLEWGKESPTGPNDPVLNIESAKEYASLSPLEIARVNYLITRWGQTESNEQAAAVAMAIWMRYPGSIDPFFSEHRFVRASIPDAQLRESIAQRAREMNAEADLFTPIVREAAGAVAIVPDAEDPRAGEVTVTGLPEETLGTLQITGAIFDNTTAYSAAGIAEGEVLRYTAVPEENGQSSHEISVEGVFITPGQPGDEIIVWRTPDSFQDLAQSSQVIPDFQFSLTSAVEIPLPQGQTGAETLANTGSAWGSTLVPAIAVLCLGSGMIVLGVWRRRIAKK